jgi:hypothetical protein
VVAPTLAPEVIAAIDAREKLGLRTDVDFVRAVLADPFSVRWNGVPVTREEWDALAGEQLDQAMLLRANLDLPADEATVRALLADPRTRLFNGAIPMSPAEFAAFTDREANIMLAGPIIRAYGEEHPDEWAGYYVDDDTFVVIGRFTGHVDEHRRAVEALFAPGEARVEIREARWTLRELKTVERRVRRATDWIERQGVTLEGFGIREAENQVVVDVRIPEPDPGLAARIIDHLGAEGKLRVEVEVVPVIDFSDAGVLVLRIFDTNGRDTDGVHCWLQSDARVTAGEAEVMAEDHGVCRWEVVKPVAVHVTVWRSFRAGLLGEVRGEVRPKTTTSLTLIVTLP